MKRSSKLLIAAVLIGAILMVIPNKFISLPFTRGFRNRNPGNIRHSSGNNWYGMTGQDKDGFVIFDTVENGIDAIGEIIDSYKRRGVQTLRQIIYAWAPPADSNDTEAYLGHVLKLTGYPEDFIPFRDSGDYTPIVAAIIHHENGSNPYDNRFIAAALARST